jgi:hypothetical protein
MGLHYLRSVGIEEESRAGRVLRAPGPVTTVYTHPLERVVFWSWRDANPFFHCIEALWMLAGRDDLKQLTPYVARMADFSDDGGVTQPGAYGKRWRDHHVPLGPDTQYAWNDQLNWAVKRFRDNTADRRVVVQMYDAGWDQHAADLNGNDIPCNLTMLPWVQGGALHLTIFNRSNDILWGLYGANAVHFSTALEYLAGRIGLPVGTMTTVSNNFHAYVDRMPNLLVPMAVLARDGWLDDPYYQAGPTYRARQVEPYPLFTEWTGPEPDAAIRPSLERIIQEDLRIFFEHGAVEAATKARWPYIRRVAVPLALAHQHWRTKRGEERYRGALRILDQCVAPDWRLAAQQWINRRRDAWIRRGDSGVAGRQTDLEDRT